MILGKYPRVVIKKVIRDARKEVYPRNVGQYGVCVDPDSMEDGGNSRIGVWSQGILVDMCRIDEVCYSLHSFPNIVGIATAQIDNATAEVRSVFYGPRIL